MRTNGAIARVKELVLTLWLVTWSSSDVTVFRARTVLLGEVRARGGLRSV